MAEIIFYSDTHLGFDYPVRNSNFRGRRGEDFFTNNKKVLDFAVQHKADAVVHGGDLFFRTLIPKKIQYKVYDKLFEFAENGIPLIIVPGNHESSRLPQSLLIQHRNIYVFKKPETFHFEMNGLKIGFSGFPCVRKGLRLKYNNLAENILAENQVPDIRILCMHQTVDGSSIGPKKFYFRNHDDFIDWQDIDDRFDAYLSGHIHCAQVLKKKVGKRTIPFIYPGSVERTSFQEMNETKGFFQLEISKVEQETKIHARFHKLGTRKMEEIKLESFIEVSKINDELTTRFRSFAQGTVVRIRMNEYSTEVYQLLAELKKEWKDKLILMLPSFHSISSKQPSQ